MGDGARVRTADGFLRRGDHVTRLEAFVDAAFAFAVTLLVISIDAIPDSRVALVEALKAIPAFAACFAMLAMFWAAHARWSRRYGLDDATTTTASLALVFVVLVYVYPLRLQFGVFFSWVTDGWLPSPMAVAAASDVSFMFVVYGLAFGTMSLCMLGLYLHAWRRRDALSLDAGERAGTVGEAAIYAFFVLVALASVALALSAPATRASWWLGIPGAAYSLLGLTGVVEAYAARWQHGRMGQAP